MSTTSTTSATKTAGTARVTISESTAAKIAEFNAKNLAATQASLVQQKGGAL